MTAPSASATQSAAAASVSADLLRGKDYERLAQLLCAVDATRSRSGDTRLIHIADAAHRLFHTCQRYQAEGEAHLAAYFSTQQRELALLRELHAIIDVVLYADTLPASAATDAPSSGATPAAPAERLPRRFVATFADDSRRDSLFQTGAQSAEVLRTGSAEQDPPAETTALCDDPAAAAAPTLDIYCLSPFQVFRDDRQITDWPNSKGKCLFKYLAANRERPVPKEVLMDVFWPGAEANAARNNLNVAVYGLRKELSDGGGSFPFILFQDGCYLLNPALRIWVDVEAFREHREAALRLEQAGQLEAAIQQYRAAEVIYQQPFLAEDRYEDWIDPMRQATERAYMEILDRLGQHYFEHKDYDACALVCRKMLGVDGCDEAAHRLLMRCYARLAQPHLALRQFHACVDALSRELKIHPSLQTVELFKRVKQQQAV